MCRSSSHGKRARCSDRRRRRLRHCRGGAQASSRCSRLTQVEIDDSVVEFAEAAFSGVHQARVVAIRRFDLVIDDGMVFCRPARAALRRDRRRFHRSAGTGRGPVQQALLFGLPARAQSRRHDRDPERRARVAAARTRRHDEEAGQPVRRRDLLCRRDPDLCRRLHGDGLCHRRPQGARALGDGDRGAPPRAGGFATRYWTPALHRAAFALPRFIGDIVDRATR